MTLRSQIAELQALLAARDAEIMTLAEENEALRAQMGTRHGSVNDNSYSDDPQITAGVCQVLEVDVEDDETHLQINETGTVHGLACSLGNSNGRYETRSLRKRLLLKDKNGLESVKEDEVEILLGCKRGRDDPARSVQSTRKKRVLSAELTAATSQSGEREVQELPTRAEDVRDANHEEPSVGAAGPLVELPADEATKFLLSLLHPDIKVKVKKDFSLEHIVYDRLKSFGFTEKLDLELSHKMRTFMVRRKWMCTNLGGCVQKMVGRPSEAKRRLHGCDHFLYLSLKYHPDAPKAQGVPGIFYGVVEAEYIDNAFPPLARTFVNVAQDGNYLYMGNYEVRQAAPLTTHEWLSLSSRIRKSWSDVMSTADWGRKVRIRMTLRRRLPEGEELTVASIDEAAATADKYMYVCSDDVHEAFATGEEHIQVWCMKPVVYDEALVKKLMKWTEVSRTGHALQF